MTKFKGKAQNNEYLRWIKDHAKEGVVLTLPRKTLHTADCPHIKYGNIYDATAAKSKKLRSSDIVQKICFDSVTEAQVELKRMGINAKRCRSCRM